MNNLVLTQDEVKALLGRSLTQVETENFNIYLELAQSRLNDQICCDITKVIEIPMDLKLVLARMFNVITQEQDQQANSNIASKKVEDFQINYRDTSTTNLMGTLVTQNQAILAKYSKCKVTNIRHGETVLGGDNYDCGGNENDCI